MYSANPALGQRAVAKATQKEFNLTTFSHSTVSRSFKKMEQHQKQALGNRFGEIFQITSDTSQAPVNTPEYSAEQEKLSATRSFPSIEDTAVRRAAISAFLKTLHEEIKKGAIEVAGRHFVKYWYDKTRRLLI
jgi:hypothetical protein